MLVVDQMKKCGSTMERTKGSYAERSLVVRRQQKTQTRNLKITTSVDGLRQPAHKNGGGEEMCRLARFNESYCRSGNEMNTVLRSSAPKS